MFIASQVNENCYGQSNGSAIVAASNGNPPYKYLWNNGATTIAISSLDTGTYSCIVTDLTGCTGSTEVTITQPPAIDTVVKTTGVCYGYVSGGSATISVTGGIPPYSLQWSTGSTDDSITNVGPGSYLCKITDAKGCIQYAVAQINPAPELKIDSMVAYSPSCDTCKDGGARVYVSGGIPQGDSNYYFYVWGNGSTNGPLLNNLDSGMYSVCVTSPQGCGSVCDSVNVVSGIRLFNGLPTYIKVFPVPSSGVINIVMPENGLNNISITNELGELVYSVKISDVLGNKPVSVDLSSLPNGIYIMQVATIHGTATGKVIIQR